MENFTPDTALLGGILIGLGAAMVLLFTGRVAGISGIYGGMLHAKHGDTLWRFLFIAGLLVGGVVLMFTLPSATDIKLDLSPSAVVLAGLLVGIGTRLGNGCTSGHGVCGIGRLSPRSLVSAMVFVGVGIVVSSVVHTYMQGAL
jgi:uncharacterized membrane protein YedE/YeeE